MEFDEVIEKRHSVRSFKDKVVPWEHLIEAADAAKDAPFAGNHNNLRFIIIEEKEMVKKLAQFTDQSWVNDAGAMVVVCSDERHLHALYGERGILYSKMHAGAAIENFILKLADRGLGSCWLGSFSEDLVKLALGIPDYIKVDAMIAVGYEKGKTKRPVKRDLQNAVYWEVWERKRRPLVYKEPPVDKI